MIHYLFGYLNMRSYQWDYTQKYNKYEDK